jgi:hypothetical protein
LKKTSDAAGPMATSFRGLESREIPRSPCGLNSAIQKLELTFCRIRSTIADSARPPGTYNGGSAGRPNGLRRIKRASALRRIERASDSKLLQTGTDIPVRRDEWPLAGQSKILLVSATIFWIVSSVKPPAGKA